MSTKKTLAQQAEAQWLDAIDSDYLRKDVGVAGSSRKFRLFACACARRRWGDIKTAECRVAVETSERVADGLAKMKELSNAHTTAFRAAFVEIDKEVSEVVGIPPRMTADRAAYWAAEKESYWAAYWAADWAADGEMDCPYRGAEKKIQADLFRDIFGNPFRTVTLDPRWLTSDVVGLSHAIYGQRDYDLLPILADALMEAGCDSIEMIQHCRGEGLHVRGCWVVDLLLGKG